MYVIIQYGFYSMILNDLKLIILYYIVVHCLIFHDLEYMYIYIFIYLFLYFS